MNHQLFVFLLDGRKYALPLEEVQRVVRAVEIVPLPGAPDIVLGVIEVRGRILPVVNVRKRFNLPVRELDLSDQIVIARTSKRTLALVIDSSAGLAERPDEAIISAQELLPDAGYITGVVRIEDGIVLIHNLDAFLSLEEEENLEAAMSSSETE